MTFKEFIREAVLYRGVGKRSTNKNLIFYTTDEKQADGYAYARGTDDIQVSNISVDNVIDLGHDELVLSASSLVSKFIKSVDITRFDKNKLATARSTFIKYYGRTEYKIHHFWRDDNSKREMVKLIKAFNYKGVKLKEDGVMTYGMVK